VDTLSEMNKLTQSAPPAYMFSAAGSPTSVQQDLQLGMHEVRLDNFQDDFLPSPEELKVHHIKKKINTITSKRWLRSLFIFSLFLIIFLSLLIVFLHKGSTSSEKKDAKVKETWESWRNPSGSISVDSRLAESIKLLLDDVDHKVLTDTKSPQFQAAQWIADIDTQRISLNETKFFKQRYALALLWFATSGENWNQSVKFLTDTHECEWRMPYQRQDRSVFEMGVQCNPLKEVTSLVLQEMNLTGRIPQEIRMLSNLERLSLDRNNLTDFGSLRPLKNLNELTVGYNHFSTPIPDWIGELSNIIVLSLSKSGFSSTLPTQLKKLTELSTLALDGNDISGTLDIIEQMPWLENLYLARNFFSGTIKDNFLQHLEIIEVLDLSSNQFRGQLGRSFLRNRPRLQILDLHDNFLEGPLPDMPRLSSLIFLDLRNNLFNSSIPISIDGLSALRHFDVSNNRLSGDLPNKHLSKLTQLEFFSISSNHLFKSSPIPDFSMLSNLKELGMMNTARTGTFPTWIGNLTELILLNLNSNRLNSSIPSEIYHLSNLKFLLLNDNKLSGNVPKELGIMSRLEILLLDKNDLKGKTDSLCYLDLLEEEKPVIIADCENEINCECCSLCCSDDKPDECYDKGWLSFHAWEWEDHYSRSVFQHIEQQLILP